MLKKELEVGKTYIDGDGKNITIVSNDNHGVYPYNSEEGHSYTNYGMYSVTNRQTIFNLVREADTGEPNQPKGEGMIEQSVLQSLIDDFLSEEDDFGKQNSKFVLNKFRNFIFKADIEKEARRKQYEELKKEFEAQ